MTSTKNAPPSYFPATVLTHIKDVCVLAISTAEHRTFSLRPKVKAGDGGLQRDSWVKCDHPTTVEKILVIYPSLGSLSGAAMQAIETAVKAALQLP